MLTLLTFKKQIQNIARREIPVWESRAVADKSFTTFKICYYEY